VIISAFGRNFTINNLFPVQEGEHLYILDSPHIRPVNEFLTEFANSSEKTIELTSEAIALNPAATPLRALQGLEYEKIRLRLRALSNLNPVVNLKAEEGVIRFSRRLASDMMQDFEIRSVFAPKGQSIQLEKLRSSVRALAY
jgi:hypothetical protein